jgi:hypothetical protein
MNVTNSNVGNFNHGYKIWEFTAGDYECTEVADLVRSTWWTETDEVAAAITINVIPV